LYKFAELCNSKCRKSISKLTQLILAAWKDDFMKMVESVPFLNLFLFLLFASATIEKIRSASAFEYASERTASTNFANFEKDLLPSSSSHSNI